MTDRIALSSMWKAERGEGTPNHFAGYAPETIRQLLAALGGVSE
jgi:hypothetical protein